MTHNTPASESPVLTGKLYDILKKISLIYLPGLSTLYFTIAQILGLPAAEKVVGVIAAVNVFLGLIVNQSAKNFTNSDARFDGNVVVTKNEETGGKLYSLELNGDPAKMDEKNELIFRVVPAAA